jgi:hypothetical protein
MIFLFGSFLDFVSEFMISLLVGWPNNSDRVLSRLGSSLCLRCPKLIQIRHRQHDVTPQAIQKASAHIEGLHNSYIDNMKLHQIP